MTDSRAQTNAGAAHASRTAREFDIVLWGATGYTGRRTAERLAEVGAGLTWALAGRNAAKLARVRDELAERWPASATIPIVTADAGDTRSLEAMAARARVVCTTVGPYASFGEPLVAACVETRTDYCDLTGELQFVRAMIDQHHDVARARGVRIVHAAGYDSVPSDLGVRMVAEYARQRWDRALSEVRNFSVSGRMGLSGGTAGSALGMMERFATDRAMRAVVGDPYAFSPDRAHDVGLDRNDSPRITWEPTLRRWSAPFIMGPFNGRIVRRSNALAGYSYGRQFRYAERLATRGTPQGFAVAAGTTAVLGLAAVLGTSAPGRAILRRVLPKSGEGPSADALARGRWTYRMLATLEGADAPTIEATIADARDPGYGSACVLLVECARSLAIDPPLAGGEGGVLTPAVAIGTRILPALRDAGMTWDVGERERS